MRVIPSLLRKGKPLVVHPMTAKTTDGVNVWLHKVGEDMRHVVRLQGKPGAWRLVDDFRTRSGFDRYINGYLVKQGFTVLECDLGPASDAVGAYGNRTEG